MVVPYISTRWRVVGVMKLSRRFCSPSPADWRAEAPAFVSPCPRIRRRNVAATQGCQMMPWMAGSARSDYLETAANALTRCGAVVGLEVRWKEC